MKPMRAKDFNINKDLPFDFPVICQPKKNGVRGPWSTEHAELFSRRGNILTGLPHIREAILRRGYGNIPLDGELFTPNLPFEEINGLCRKKKPANHSSMIELHIFDIAVEDVEMEERLDMLNELKECDTLKIVPFVIVHTKAELIALYEHYLSIGEEGLIIRTMDGFYEEELYHDDLFRLIPVHELEATLIGLNPATTAMHKDTFGSIRLRLPSGIEFNCSGCTEDQRQIVLNAPLGSNVTVQYKRLSNSGKPVNSSFKDLRWDV